VYSDFLSFFLLFLQCSIKTRDIELDFYFHTHCPNLNHNTNKAGANTMEEKDER
jgi:hypothetical protein